MFSIIKICVVTVFRNGIVFNWLIFEVISKEWRTGAMCTQYEIGYTHQSRTSLKKTENEI